MEQELTNLFWKGPENVLGLPATACQLQLLNSVAWDQPQTMSINRWACLLVKLPLWKQALGKSCQWIVACWLVSWGWWQQVTVVECLPSARTSCPFSSWIFTKHCEVHVSVITPILQVRKRGSQEVSFAQGLMDSKGSSQDFKPGGLSLETMFFFF